MSARRDFSLRFWGVRGSIPTPGAGTMRYGGNTACIEVRCGDYLMIFDAGSGLRPFGDRLIADRQMISTDIFLTHTHLDHIAGLPFFTPIYRTGNRMRIWAGHLPEEGQLVKVLGHLLDSPLLPISPASFKAEIAYRQFRAGDVLDPHPGVSIRTAPLNHPGGCTGYRIEFAGRAVALVFDHEHIPGRDDYNVLRLVDGADVLVYDAMYTEEEYPAHRGWGHSTWQEGCRLAEKARVGKLVLFHHAPSRTDEALDRIEADADARLPGTVAAREGEILHP